MPKTSDALTPGWITTFLAVAKHRNYTRAAKELYVTQPAVSRQMIALQRAVGVPLVEQLGKSLELTDAGRALAREAERVQAGIARAVEVLDAIRGGAEGRLRVGASTTPGFYILPKVLGAFLERRPTIELGFSVDNSRAIEGALQRNEIDLGFVGGPVASTELVTEPLVKDELVVFASRSSPLARRSEVSPEELVGQRLIAREEGSATRRLFDAWLAQRHLSPGRRIELRCPEAVKTLVAAGVGIAATSCHGLDAKDARFRALNVPGLQIGRQILIARHRDKRLTALQEEFLAAVRASVG